MDKGISGKSNTPSNSGNSSFSGVFGRESRLIGDCLSGLLPFFVGSDPLTPPPLAARLIATKSARLSLVYFFFNDFVKLVTTRMASWLGTGEAIPLIELRLFFRSDNDNRFCANLLMEESKTGVWRSSVVMIDSVSDPRRSTPDAMGLKGVKDMWPWSLAIGVINPASVDHGDGRLGSTDSSVAVVS